MLHTPVADMMELVNLAAVVGTYSSADYFTYATASVA